jgi:hypothetical protein
MSSQQVQGLKEQWSGHPEWDSYLPANLWFELLRKYCDQIDICHQRVTCHTLTEQIYLFAVHSLIHPSRFYYMPGPVLGPGDLAALNKMD